jgi:TonB family protein
VGTRMILPLVCLLSLFNTAIRGQTRTSSRALTDRDVVSLVKAGVGAQIILAKIGKSACDFDTSPAALEQLKVEKVPDKVSLALIDCRSSENVHSHARRSALTNGDVVSLVKAGVGAQIILAKIHNSSCNFDTSPAALERLKVEKVPDKVSLAMIDCSPSEPVRGYTGGRIFSVGGDVSPPAPIYDPEPEYSERARAANLQGADILSIVVTEEGNVEDVRVVRPLGLGLDEEAMRTVRTWKFKPCMKDGKPVSCRVHIPVTFRLF